MTDTALRSEPRTIGGPVDSHVLVIAPSNREAQEWAHRNGVLFSDTVHIGLTNYWHAMVGFAPGVRHVILRWYAFDAAARDYIRTTLAILESEPYETSAELPAAADLRD